MLLKENLLNHVFNSITFVENFQNLRTMKRFSTTPTHNSESVMEHSFVTAMITLFIAKRLQQHSIPINLEKALIMALIHDLPESKISDIPFDAKQNLPIEKDKLDRVELAVILELFHLVNINNGDDGDRHYMAAIFHEFTKRESLEAKIVDIADKVEVMIFAKSELKLGNSSFHSIKKDIHTSLLIKTNKLFDKLNEKEDGKQ